jgi:hypothetical protein
LIYLFRFSFTWKSQEGWNTFNVVERITFLLNKLERRNYNELFAMTCISNDHITSNTYSTIFLIIDLMLVMCGEVSIRHDFFILMFAFKWFCTQSLSSSLMILSTSSNLNSIKSQSVSTLKLCIRSNASIIALLNIKLQCISTLNFSRWPNQYKSI